MSSPSTANLSPPSSDGLSAGATAVTIIMVVAGAVVLIVIAILITKCYLKRKLLSSNVNVLPISNTNMQSTSNRLLASKQSTDSKIEFTSVERFLDELLKEKPIRFSPQHLIDFTGNYSVKLGSGGFGEVYKGQLPNGVLVAVKVLRGTLTKRAEEQFMAEVGTIGRTYHINLVRLYGFCFDATVRALVYEYMENGSLDRYLFDKTHKIEWKKLHEIAVGAAKGIRYLHEECQRKIVHYDIKPGNVLLSANFSPKVADFGLAKYDRDSTHIALTGARGTPGYAAPEMWSPVPLTHKCDVYSFGMLLFEILGRRRNLEFDRPESQEWFPRWIWKKFEQGQLDSVMPVCGIEEEDKDKAQRMSKVALWCVQYNPETRPSMSSVVKMLEGEEEIVAPVNPFQYMGSELLWSSKSTGDLNSKETENGGSEIDSSLC